MSSWIFNRIIQLFITVKNSKSGIATSLRFSIAQDLRDLSLWESFVDFFFECGFVAKYKIV
jgi:hypothetical protein